MLHDLLQHLNKMYYIIVTSKCVEIRDLLQFVGLQCQHHLRLLEVKLVRPFSIS